MCHAEICKVAISTKLELTVKVLKLESLDMLDFAILPDNKAKLPSLVMQKYARPQLIRIQLVGWVICGSSAANVCSGT